VIWRREEIDGEMRCGMGGAALDASDFTTADPGEAIGMRIPRIAEEMSSGSRYQGRSDRLIEDVERLLQDVRKRVGSPASSPHAGAML
jgi:hypothetical protein